MRNLLAGISSMATRQILSDLVGAYEARTGARIKIDSVGGVDALRRIRAGEAVDAIILASGAMSELEREGRILVGSRAAFARSGMAIAAPEGALRPAIGDEEAVKQALLRAKAVCYSTGPSGDHLKHLWERWGIGEAVAARAVQAPPGTPVAALLAKGEADLGVQQLSELMDMPGIVILGPLPAAIQTITLFEAGVAIASVQPDATRAFIDFLCSPEADAVKRRRGMEPAEPTKPMSPH